MKVKLEERRRILAQIVERWENPTPLEVAQELLALVDVLIDGEEEAQDRCDHCGELFSVPNNRCGGHQ